MMSKTFYYKEKHLICEQVDVQSWAARTPTPFFLYSKREILENTRQVLQAGAGLDYLACFAFKANYNPSILKLMRDVGLGADVVSGGELQWALKLGFDADKIVFAGVGKTAEEIELAIQAGIYSLNIESAEELHQTEAVAARLQKPMRIAIRINPDIEVQTHAYISTGRHINKFGVSSAEALMLFKQARQSRWLKPEGLHVHIGSQITVVQPFLQAVKFLRDFYEKLQTEQIKLRFLDLGGGIGINYQNNFLDDQAPHTYLKKLLPAYLKGFGDLKVKLMVELGRSLIASAGLLVSKVLYRKETPLKKFIVVDAAMNNLIRPSLYNAHHEVVPLQLKDGPRQVADVVGPVCESGDFLAKDRELPWFAQGDFLAVTGAGAYGQALASNYNLRPKIAEYLVDRERIETIYKGESIEDIYRQYEV